MENKLIQESRHYFKCFQKKDLEKLSNIFASTIYLEDWENKIKGKKKNLNFLKKIFNKNSFNIKIQKFFLHKTKKIISCQILITLNNKKKIKVIDIISFNKKLKITKIEAYKC
jgi:hypothetical protein|tara:strand:- start:233 stop:571 length:339 start_codon:yes stop_codon:yes gene_type:complete